MSRLNPMDKWMLASLASAAAAITVLAFDATPTTPPSTPAAVAQQPVSLSPAPGEALRYALDHTWTQALTLGSGQLALPVSVDVELGGSLLVEGLPSVSGERRAAISFIGSDSGHIHIMGTDLMVDSAALDGRVVVVFDADGPRAVHFPPHAKPALRWSIQALLPHVWPARRSAARWTATGRDLLGERSADFEQRDARHLVRRIIAYRALGALPGDTDLRQRVDGTSTFEFDAEGRLVDLRANEALDARSSTRSRFESRAFTRLRLVEIAPADGPPVAVGPALPPFAPFPESEARRAILEQQARGLTSEDLLEMLDGFGGELPDHRRTLSKAVARLRLDPALCQEVARRASKPGRTRGARAVTLDLLASAGTPEAQMALTSMLDEVAVQSTDRYGLLFQRAGLVENPEPALLEWLAEHDGRPGPEGAHAAAYALGAASGKAVRRGDGLGIALADSLLSRVAQAETATERALRIRAAGNARLEAHGPELARWAADDEPVVRLAVAAALQANQHPDVTQTLLSLALDVDPGVQTRALRALGGRRLDGALLDELADAVRAGQFEARHLDILALRVAERSAEPAARALLEAMLAAAPRSSGVATRLRAILEGV